MKLCAVTMVYRDYWALSQWYAHYARALGAENLYIVCHGPDPKVAAACPKANVFSVPREDMQHFDSLRSEMLNNLQNGLAQVYDWVIRTDADELICLDPQLFTGFEDLFSQNSGDALFALGLEVFESPTDSPIPDGTSALNHRRSAVFSGHYSKAWAVRKRIGLKRHGIKIRSKLVESYPFVMPPGVYLAHLKYANFDVLWSTNEVRKEVARSKGKGLPGTAWRKADRLSKQKILRATQLPELPWDQARDQAWAALQSPLRDPKNGLVRTRSLRFEARTQLPDWFANL
ncbi:glycosyltransferase family 2 protein [Aliisedimentitalea scapharcae]|uniref:Glycosyltransferase family 2 protein n=1 Tax=Aliisedimentitalea scapharcae TaxID=1524259 RepID=A0ABZ2XR99_9RHOB